jgi:predicted Zn-ribbon and HTH transcriptional regulator
MSATLNLAKVRCWLFGHGKSEQRVLYSDGALRVKSMFCSRCGFNYFADAIRKAGKP